ncbi:MAG: hypothetical protein ABC611_08290 [Candidatus Methanosuratincola petrocarbonis]
MTCAAAEERIALLERRVRELEKRLDCVADDLEVLYGCADRRALA